MKMLEFINILIFNFPSDIVLLVDSPFLSNEVFRISLIRRYCIAYPCRIERNLDLFNSPFTASRFDPSLNEAHCP